VRAAPHAPRPRLRARLGTGLRRRSRRPSRLALGLAPTLALTLTLRSIRNNFVLIYELLDEVLDYGYPQNCSTDVLKMYITQQGDKSAAAERASSQAVTIQATGAISWRKEGIKYRKNELFIDVVENCNLLVSNKGTILRNDVSGVIMVKCYLSGTPECKFGLNDKLLLDNEAKVRPPPPPPPYHRRTTAAAAAATAAAAAAAAAAPSPSPSPSSHPHRHAGEEGRHCCSPSGLGHRDRRRLLPPVRQARQVRHGPHHLLCAARRRVPAHVLPHHRER
jgi:hypothetical protein